MKTPRVSFIIDPSKERKDGSYSIKLNIYFDGKKKRYATVFYTTLEEWERLNKPNLKDRKLNEIKTGLNRLKEEVTKLIEQQTNFSFDVFETKFFGKGELTKNSPLKDIFDEYIQMLENENKIKTASVYKSTINSLESFRKNITIKDVNDSFIKEYQKHLNKQSKSPSTIGIYLRHLRSIINRAIAKDIISRDDYPFRNVQIPTSRNIKKALNSSDLSKLLNHRPENKRIRTSLNYWLFSYLCNGMNFKDIALLTNENTDGNYLWFRREKTKNTKVKDTRPIHLPLNSRAKQILEENKNFNPQSKYLFPILEEDLTPKTIDNRVHRFIKKVNEDMNKIAEELEINVHITTYTARHSFSTILKQKGAPTSFIKDALGHSSVTTTENYLDDFPDDVKSQFSNFLTEL